MTRCACKRPKPATITEDQFDGLFADVPIATFACVICDRCGGMVRDWHATPTEAA